MGGVETALGIRADSRVTFSPDGKRMAYLRSEVEPSGLVTARLFVAKTDGTGEEFLNWEAGDSVYQRGAPAWSPDGKVIAFSIIAKEGGGTHEGDRCDARRSKGIHAHFFFLD